MSKYFNETIGGSRVRVNRVIIDYRVGETPEIRFIEEQVVKLTDGTEKYIEKGRDITFIYDGTKSFELRNPETDELLGLTSTEQDVFIAFYSLIRSKQNEKDVEEVATRLYVEPNTQSPQPE